MEVFRRLVSMSENNLMRCWNLNYGQAVVDALEFRVSDQVLILGLGLIKLKGAVEL